MKWRAFPLHPDTPEQGLTLEELFSKKGVPINVDKVVAELKSVAARFGLPFGDRKMTYNSRLAQELGLWAQFLGKGQAFHNEAFRAYFVRGENIALKSVLLGIAAASGLDRGEALEVLEKRLYKDEVDRDWELSRSKGVTAAPTFFMGLDRLVGAQSYEILERMVLKYTEKGSAGKKES